MILKFIRIDVENSTIESTWVENTETAQVPISCRNYSESESAEFAADVDGAEGYMRAAGWSC